MFDSAKVMVGQRLTRCTHGGSCEKRKCRSSDIQDNFPEICYCRFKSSVKLSERGGAQNFSAYPRI